MKNIPITRIDPFTGSFNLEWESIAGNRFREKVLNGTINMLSTEQGISRLLLTVNHLEGKDYLILRHPSKDYMLDVGDKFFILFKNNEVIELEIVKKSFHLFNSNTEYFNQIYENRIVLYKDDLEKLSQNLIEDWRILISGKRKIEGMSIFGYEHDYNDRESLQIALKDLFYDYYELVNSIKNYQPLVKHELKDEVSHSESCYLYLMKDLANGYYKIGISNKPSYREKTLQSEKPTIELLISKGFSKRRVAAAFESSLHKCYENKRLRGEWFELTESDLVEIDEILK